MCFIGQSSRPRITSAVKELVSKDHFQKREDSILTLSTQDENFLGILFNTLEENWQDPHFILDDFCHKMAMSKSQFYRKTIALSRLSPKALLKDYRLENAKALLKMGKHNISEICFESGFTSPSYFTKCFKKKYGILPMAYIDML